MSRASRDACRSPLIALNSLVVDVPDIKCISGKVWKRAEPVAEMNSEEEFEFAIATPGLESHALRQTITRHVPVALLSAWSSHGPTKSLYGFRLVV